MEQIATSVTEAARALGLGRTKTYELITSGALETLKVGRRTLVTTHSLRAFAQAVRNRP